jgi:isopentenyl-diphosphate delta-isomerase
MAKRPSSTAPRKRHHLELVLNEDVAFRSGNGLDRYELAHDALPELHLDDIDLTTSFLGHRLKLPLLISSMTGGTDEAGTINRRLAKAAQRVGCAMALGSQRAALEDKSLEASFRVRDAAPDILLFANLGAVQLNYGYGLEECLRAVEMIEADALFLHLNSLQEALQPEGDRDFRGLLAKLRQLTEDLPCPLLLKTTGNGISDKTARKLAGLQLAGLEVSGAGGTSWARIETLRSGDTEARVLFGDMGEDTAESIVVAREHLPGLPLIGSGGMVDGVQLAKVLALGAQLGGFARSLLAPAAAGEDAVTERLERIAEELRTACFYCGVAAARELGPSDLRQRR